jgi:exodeoxyribonuclease-5
MTDLSPDQLEAVDQIAQRLDDGADEVTLGGLAGTGKTTLGAQLPKLLGRSAVFAAPTARAASNLQQRGVSATTIHQLIYGAPVADRGDLDWRIRPDSPLRAARLLVIDEASMVSQSIADDLRGFGVPIVWIGDHGQLPPVEGRCTLMENPDVLLETIHRQAADSPIIGFAHEVRAAGRLVDNPMVREWLPGPQGIGEIDIDTLHLCATNKHRVAINRKARLGCPDDPIPGDRVVCLRNDSRTRTYNGMLGAVVECRRMRTSDRYHASIRPDGTNRTYSGYISARQFHQEETLHDVSREIGLWDYSYALTVHKAQGGEANRVRLLVRRDDAADHRWLYTGITRARRELEVLAA